MLSFNFFLYIKLFCSRLTKNFDTISKKNIKYYILNIYSTISFSIMFIYFTNTGVATGIVRIYS